MFVVFAVSDVSDVYEVVVVGCGCGCGCCVVVICGLRFAVCGLWSVVCGLRFVVRGSWFVVGCGWLVVGRLIGWSVVTNPLGATSEFILLTLVTRPRPAIRKSAVPAYS